MVLKNNAKLIERVKEARALQNLSVRALAKMARISASTVDGFLNNRYETHPNNIDAILRVLGLEELKIDELETAASLEDAKAESEILEGST